ncbi:MAG: hypothetical protein ABEJ81_01555 [Haloferacaceae archaeon]
MASDETTADEEAPAEPPEEPAHPLTRAYRTVTPPYVGRPDAEMNTVGWMLFLGVVFLLFPLLPVILVVWLLSKLVETVAGRGRS